MCILPSSFYEVLQHRYAQKASMIFFGFFFKISIAIPSSFSVETSFRAPFVCCDYL